MTHLSPKRWVHTIGVVKTARALAKRWGADEEKAEFAAYAHDLGKEFTTEKNAEYINQYQLPKKYLDYPEVTHGHIAAAILQNEYGVFDEDILNAVRYHSTGRADMSLLEKIIYLADLTEVGRTYRGVEEIRELTFQDLDDACILAFQEVIKFVEGQGVSVEEDTINALTFLKNQKPNER